MTPSSLTRPASSPIPPLRVMALKSAFTGLTIVAGLVGSVVLGGPLPALASLLVLGVWVLIAPWLPPVQRRYLERRREAEARARVAEEQALLRGVSEADRRRFLELDALRRDIHRLATTNPSLALEMMQPELGKLDALVRGFLDLTSKAARYETYAATTDLAALDEARRQHARAVEEAGDESTRDLARRNLELVERRIEKAGEMRALVDSIRGELSLIESGLRLFRDEVATLDSVRGLGPQLDELVRSVEAIGESSRETEELLARAAIAGSARALK